MRSINVESEGELQALQVVAQELGITAAVALRVNPDVAVDTPHRYTRTGERGMKFGIPSDRIVPVARAMASMPNVKLIGLASHLGLADRGSCPVRAGRRSTRRSQERNRTRGSCDARHARSWRRPGGHIRRRGGSGSRGVRRSPWRSPRDNPVFRFLSSPAGSWWQIPVCC